jgi:hypothetical protein
MSDSLLRWKRVWKTVILVMLLMAAGAAAGFFVLGYAMQNEPKLTAGAIFVLSPGLKVAEYFTPITRQSLGSTFGNFLRVAILINSVFYFVIFTAVVALARFVVCRKKH